jgi:hypothetical protein
MSSNDQDKASKLNAGKRRQKDSTIARDEALGARRKRNSKKEFMQQQKELFELLKDYPEKFQANDLGHLRDFFLHVSKHPNEYKLDSKAGGFVLLTAGNFEQFDHSAVFKKLTPSFVKSVVDHSWEHIVGAEPIVQVLATDHGKFQAFSSRFQNVKIVTLSVVDQDGDVMTARIAPHLTEIAVHLTKGTIVRLNMFNDVLVQVKEGTPFMPAIAVTQMDVLGSGPLVKEATEFKSSHTDTVISSDSDEKVDVSESTLFHDSNEYEPPPKPPACSYGNRLCSMHGTVFRRCICEKVPVDAQDIELIKTCCPFAPDIDVGTMENGKKRFLLYWWYATNLYMICGKKHREELPPCLVYAIRCLYPNPKGELYVGFKESEL